ncbi:MAG TPA: AraC family transcriptional regulator [Solimonas sp.]
MAVTEKGTIAVAFVRQALDALRRRGLDPAPVLAASGIDAALVAQDDARVSPEAFGALWLRVAEALDDELFGLDSRPMKVGSFATLTHLMLHTPTLREALIRGARLINLLIEDTRVELELDGGADETVAAIRLIDVGRLPLSRRIFAHETLFVMLHGLMCWLVRRRIALLTADFAYARPAWHREYRPIFGERLRFDVAQTVFRFRALDLAAPITQTERTAREFLRGAPGTFVVKYRDPGGVAVRLRRLLRELPPEAWPRFEDFAEQLGLHPSTLRRRLEDEGSSYRLETNARRRDLALQFLADPARSILSVAQALGFAEASAFHRAFREWTGLSPGRYRRQQLRGTSR